MVCHVILRDRIKALGIVATYLMKDFLMNKVMSVTEDHQFSRTHTAACRTHTAACRLPQGSVLSLLLFSCMLIF